MDIITLGGKLLITFNVLSLVVFALLFGAACFAAGYLIENRHWINLVHGKEEKVTERKALAPLANKLKNPSQGGGSTH